jgi:endo-1,3(4)-beta-glucanase
LTAVYEDLTPQLSTIHAVLSVNGTNVNATMTGDRFELALNNGQTWILYTSEVTTFIIANNTLTATTPMTGLHANRRAGRVGGDGQRSIA